MLRGGSGAGVGGSTSLIQEINSRNKLLNQGDINPAYSFEQSRVGKRRREEEVGDGDMNTIG